MGWGIRAAVIGLAAAMLCGAGASTAAEAGSRPLILKRVVFGLKDGEPWALLGDALYCDLLPKTIKWRADRSDLTTDRFTAVFGEELSRANLRGGIGDNLFDDRAASGSLQVGLLVKEMHAKVCAFDNNGRERLTFRGAVDMSVEWQIFDPLRREVIARVETTAHGEQKERTVDGVEGIIIEGVRQNARALMASPDLQKALAAGEAAAKPAAPADRSTLLIALAKDAKISLSDAAGSVVTVLTGDGHGSGFLISADGYLITNFHVVGAAKLVRIRWSDGFETEGEVIRSDKRRDVALIKSSAHSRQPLVLRPTLAHQGDTVFAIGTPVDEKLAGSVSRGVVSAYRIVEGLNYLQSDVAVNHGNSGGPLVDERGAVVGITDWGVAPNDTNIGVNFFVPIGDALDFLAIKPAPAATGP